MIYNNPVAKEKYMRYKIIKLLVMIIGLCAGYYIARAVSMSLAVPTWYKCEIVGYDLKCTTNARYIIINGKQYEK
jgi:hypothetical protein